MDGTTLDDLIAQANERLVKQAKEIIYTLEEKAGEAKQIVEAMRLESGESGTTKFAMIFKDQAEKHTKQGNKALWATALIGLLLIVVAIGSMFFHKWGFIAPAPNDTFGIVSIISSKILIFATLAYFLVLAGRSYIAHIHNAIVNRHRANSLETYRALVAAAGDQTNKDIVLTKASETIFAPLPTGFSKNEGDEGKALSQVSISPMVRSFLGEQHSK